MPNQVNISSSPLEALDLPRAAAQITNEPLDRLPPLLSERSLSEAPQLLAEHTASVFQAGYFPGVETITMPRAGFVPRPVSLMCAPSRVLYRALVQGISGELDTSPRSPERMSDHYDFGEPSGPGQGYYLVEFDIASCYEYIRHDDLRREAVFVTLKPEHVEAITSFLDGIYPGVAGLPQLLWDSDVLAELVLDSISRALTREGWHLSRIADDFRIVAHTWPDANLAIERGAELSRSWGLVLSTLKTGVYGAGTLWGRKEEVEAYIQEYFRSAEEDLTDYDVVGGDYEEGLVVVPPEKEDALRAAMRRVLEDWHQGQAEHPTLNFAAAGHAVSVLIGDAERLGDDLLADLVFKQPLRLGIVCHYMISRDEPSENWSTLARLVKSGRLSPWAKIWLFDVAAALPADGTDSQRTVVDWVSAQTQDPHEVVRCQAAWVLAKHQAITSEELARLYADASSLTHPGLAACVGALDPGGETNLWDSVRKHDPLARAASAWASGQ